jgi:SAM-dependent methyltransferase
MGKLSKAGFELAARTRLRKYLYYRYMYSFNPRELGFLVECLDRTANLPCPILEVGCAYGHTTVFLNKHLAAVGDRRQYICVDTFAGFTVGDVKYEEQERGKLAECYRHSYHDADLKTFQRTLANNEITSVITIKCDVAAWEPDLPSGVSFCLVDVDLYKPVLASLRKILPLVRHGGIVVVDDCNDHYLWDGALQAYNEFTAAEGLPQRIIGGKLGLIEVD